MCVSLTLPTLKAVLGALGTPLGALGPFLGALGKLLGRSWAVLGRSWGALGALLGGSWALLGALGAHLRKNHFLGAHLGRQNGTKNRKKLTLKNTMFTDTFFQLLLQIFNQFLAPNFDVFSIEF